MSAPARLAAFAVAVAAAFGIGFGLGDVVGPFEDAPTHQSPETDDVHGWHGTAEEQE